MTDLERFVALYKGLGINPIQSMLDDNILLSLYGGSHPAIVGYGETEIVFDAAGKFIKQYLGD